MTRSNDATRPVHRCEEWPDSDCALLDGWPTFPNARFYPSRTPEGAPSFAARLAFGFSAARKGWANNHSPIFTGPISPFQGCGLFFEGLCPSRLCSNGNSSRKRSPARSKSKLSLREWWPGTESNQPDDKPFQGCGLFFKGLRPPPRAANPSCLWGNGGQGRNRTSQTTSLFRAAGFSSRGYAPRAGSNGTFLASTHPERSRCGLSWKRWWPGTESNRRRQPFQGCVVV
jgi:hypothetical protein